MSGQRWIWQSYISYNHTLGEAIQQLQNYVCFLSNTLCVLPSPSHSHFLFPDLSLNALYFLSRLFFTISVFLNIQICINHSQIWFFLLLMSPPIRNYQSLTNKPRQNRCNEGFINHLLVYLQTFGSNSLIW